MEFMVSGMASFPAWPCRTSAPKQKYFKIVYNLLKFIAWFSKMNCGETAGILTSRTRGLQGMVVNSVSCTGLASRQPALMPFLSS